VWWTSNSTIAPPTPTWHNSRVRKKRRREIDRLCDDEYAKFDGQPTDDELVAQFMRASGLSRDLAWMLVWFIRYDNEHPALWDDILHHVSLLHGTDRRRHDARGSQLSTASAARL
jgi:hypothetical protein